MLLCSIFIASHKTAFSPHCIIQGTGANEKEDPAPKGREGDGGGTDEATNKEEGDVEKWKDEDTDEEDCVGGGQIYEVDCIVGVKWARHKDGVKKGNKPEHLFRTRWKGYGESDDTWEPLTHFDSEEISENSFSFLISPDDAQAHALQIFFR